MKTGELLARAGVPEKHRPGITGGLWKPDSLGQYFDTGPPGTGNHHDWSERDVVVLRLLLVCVRDGIENPLRADLVAALRACPEGEPMIVVHQGLIDTYYRPRWENP